MGETGPSRVPPSRVPPSRVPLGARIGHALGLTSPRRVLLLAALVCVLTLSVAVPVRNYWGQRAELAAVYAQQRMLVDKIAELMRRRSLLADPEHIETQARERLRYVRPGQAPYLVQLPPGTVARTGTGGVQASGQPWYGQLWKSINNG